MNTMTLLTLCLIMMLISLVSVSLINRAQQRSKVIRQRINHLRKTVGELEELCAAIEPLLESTQIPNLLTQELQNQLAVLMKLDNTATDLELHMAQAKQLTAELDSDRRTLPLNRLMPSDSAIAKSKMNLAEAARLVRKKHTKGTLTKVEMEEFIKELTWAHLMVDVISFIGHGHKAVTRGEHAVAHSFYKKAQNLLVNSSVEESRRHRFIREISEILANKRTALSLELMPESDFNPQVNSLKLPLEATPENITASKVRPA